MSEKKAENMTKVVGYFNPQKYSIFIEISEINLKAELGPNAYIRDRQGKYINDPIFESYCHPKGLSRTTSASPVPINFVPRFVKSTRPAAAVTQASSFVRQQDGRTIPAYPAQQNAPRETAVNKTPITGMSMEAARRVGLVGKPRLVPEDYGAAETSGAPSSSEALPSIKYSVESPPRIKTAAPLRPELMEADQDLPPEERTRRANLQQSITQASATASGDNFDPTRVRPLPSSAPVALKAPEQPTPIVPIKPGPATVTPVAPTTPPKTKPKAKAKQQPSPEVPKQVLPRKRIAMVVEPEPEAQPVQQEEEEQQPEEAPLAGTGIVEPLDESSMPAPTLDAPPADAETGKRFICAADGRPFQHRSELERHIKRNFPDMLEQLMAPYPP